MPGIGLGLRIGKTSGSVNWTPQKISSKILDGWVITGTGNLAGVINGTILTVGGNLGAYTFQVPNTAPFISADTDFIWFKRSTTQRLTTEAELVGYDFPRTLVKYKDTSPFSIEEIYILKAGETFTTDEENLMRDYCHLSIWWSGTLSTHGSNKDNRGSYSKDWNMPFNLKDGNTTGLYYFNEPTTITKDGGNLISNVKSYQDLGYDVSQITGSKQMILTADGFSAAAYNKSLQSANYTLNQPITLYIVLKNTSWASAYNFFDGYYNTVIGVMAGVSPQFRVGTAGYFSDLSSDLVLNEWSILSITFNKSTVKSTLQVDDHTVVEWYLPDGLTMGGITIGAKANMTFGAGAIYKGFIVRKTKDTTDDITEVKRMLKERFEL